MGWDRSVSLVCGALTTVWLAGCGAPPAQRTTDEFAPVRGILQQALRAATGLQGASAATALTKIAEAQGESGDRAGAAQTLEWALAAARATETSCLKEKALGPIAALQARAGEVEQALQTAEEIRTPSTRADAQAEIASVQAQAGDVTGALQTGAVITDNRSRVRALAAVALAQAQAGNLPAAQATFDRALENAAGIKHYFAKPRAIEEIARAQAQAGDIDGAFHTAGTLESGFSRASALEEIGLVQIEKRDIAGALQTAAAVAEADSIYDIKVRFLGAIAAAQAEMGDQTAAAATLQRASRVVADLDRPADSDSPEGEPDVLSDKAYDKAQALKELGEAQARLGDRVAARTTLREAFLLAPSIFWVDSECLERFLFPLARAQAEAGDIQGALETVAELRGEEVSREVFALTAIAEAQAQAGDRSAALATLDRAFRTASGIQQSNVCYTPPEVVVFMVFAGLRTRIAGVEAATAWALNQGEPAARTGALIGVAKEMMEQLSRQKLRPSRPGDREQQ